MPFKPGEIPEGAKPFQKGKSGNPKGRPRMPDLQEAIAKILSEEKDGQTALEAILSALRAKATKGDVRAAQELFDRGFGRANQTLKHEGEGFTININPK